MGLPGRRRLPRLGRKHLDRTAVMKRSRSRDDLSTCSGRHTEILRHDKTVFVRVPHVRYREMNLIDTNFRFDSLRGLSQNADVSSSNRASRVTLLICFDFLLCSGVRTMV
jgi:hypothetical protein